VIDNTALSQMALASSELTHSNGHPQFERNSLALLGQGIYSFNRPKSQRLWSYSMTLVTNKRTDAEPDIGLFKYTLHI